MNIEKDDFLHSLFHRTPHVRKEREHNLERDRKKCLEEHQSMGEKSGEAGGEFGYVTLFG